MKNSVIDRVLDFLTRLVLAAGVIAGVLIAGRFSGNRDGLTAVLLVAAGIFLPIVVVFPLLIKVRSLIDRRFRPRWYRAGVLIDWAGASESGFRDFIRDLFTAQGYEAADEGPPLDFSISRQGKKILVKTIAGNVEVRQSAIDELAEIARRRKADGVILVITGRLSDRARRVGDKLVRTIDRPQLRQLIADLLEENPEVFPSVD